MSIVVPSLSEDGWVDADGRQAEYLFSHVFLSDYSQTYIYDDQVTSLAWIIAMHDGDPLMISNTTQSRLETYFSRHFNNVVVETSIVTDPDDGNKYTLRIYLSFTGKDGVDYSLARLAFVENSLIKKVTDLSNG